MTDADDLYGASVLDHGKRPRNTVAPDPSSHSAELSNPLCGDRVRLSLRIGSDQVLEIGHDARGCLLCVASASMLTEVVRRRLVTEIFALGARFERQLTSPVGGAARLDDFGVLAAFAPVARDAMRRQCVLLPWSTLRAALGAHSEVGAGVAVVSSTGVVSGAGSAGGAAARGPSSAACDSAGAAADDASSPPGWTR